MAQLYRITPLHKKSIEYYVEVYSQDDQGNVRTWSVSETYRWGQGFATEAAQALMHHGFHTLHLAHIWAVTLPHNRRSVAVMERLGMTGYGLSRDYYGGRELLVYGRERGEGEVGVRS